MHELGLAWTVFDKYSFARKLNFAQFVQVWFHKFLQVLQVFAIQFPKFSQ